MDIFSKFPELAKMNFLSLQKGSIQYTIFSAGGISISGQMSISFEKPTLIIRTCGGSIKEILKNIIKIDLHTCSTCHGTLTIHYSKECCGRGVAVALETKVFSLEKMCPRCKMNIFTFDELRKKPMGLMPLHFSLDHLAPPLESRVSYFDSKCVQVNMGTLDSTTIDNTNIDEDIICLHCKCLYENVEI